MQYDPIKRSLGSVFNRTPFLRKLFYRLLDMLLLRAWHINKVLKAIVDDKSAGKINILDAGSGFGQYSYRMSRLFPLATIKGVDVKQEQIDDCNRFFKQIGQSKRVRFEYADLTTFTETERYNLILSVDVMEHIEEDEKVFRNFFQSLRKGGMLLISTPSDQGGSDVHDHHHDEVHGFIEEHVRDGYSIADIETKLKRAGFQKVVGSYSYGKSGSLSWRLSMKYPIQLLGISKLFFLLLPFWYILTFPFCAALNYYDVKGNHDTGTGLIVKAYK